MLDFHRRVLPGDVVDDLLFADDCCYCVFDVRVRQDAEQDPRRVEQYQAMHDEHEHLHDGSHVRRRLLRLDQLPQHVHVRAAVGHDEQEQEPDLDLELRHETVGGYLLDVPLPQAPEPLQVQPQEAAAEDEEQHGALEYAVCEEGVEDDAQAEEKEDEVNADCLFVVQSLPGEYHCWQLLQKPHGKDALKAPAQAPAQHEAVEGVVLPPDVVLGVKVGQLQRARQLAPSHQEKVRNRVADEALSGQPANKRFFLDG
mmetsp:Transcript_33857/g.95132  ORF Transcript_33857/g.95132 Transcript_33857/m.95132 type:complete len:256 (+) Transcript_33857:1894-2661(+)